MVYFIVVWLVAQSETRLNLKRQKRTIRIAVFMKVKTT
jgi:hypothetical protein